MSFQTNKTKITHQMVCVSSKLLFTIFDVLYLCALINVYM